MKCLSLDKGTNASYYILKVIYFKFNRRKLYILKVMNVFPSLGTAPKLNDVLPLFAKIHPREKCQILTRYFSEIWFGYGVLEYKSNT